MRRGCRSPSAATAADRASSCSRDTLASGVTGAGEQGESLAARLRRELMLSPALATQTMRGAAATLAGRVHGALTPERLLLLPGPRVEVRDGGESEPAYRAPEQWGGGPADARTDVYTVAVELRCPIALAYSGDLPPGAPAAVEIDEDAPAAGALRDLAGARASAPARRIGGWAALGVLLSGEAVPPSSSPPGGPVLPRAVSIL